jgi:hypothetical protein
MMSAEVSNARNSSSLPKWAAGLKTTSLFWKRSCSEWIAIRPKYVNFTAQPGDSITISITGRNSYYGSGTVVRFSSVHLWQNGA